MAEDVIEVYRTFNPAEATVLASLLADADVEAHVAQETVGGAMGEHAPELTITIRAEDGPKSAPILARFEDYVFEQHDDPIEDSEDEIRVVGKVSLPPCPSCGARRMGECSYCNTLSDSFVIEEFDLDLDQPGGEVGQLRCPVCQEPSVPRWQKQCPECEQRFAPDS